MARTRSRSQFCAAAVAVAALSGCRAGDWAPQGTAGGRCYPNGTCDQGSLCVDDTCIDIETFGCPAHPCSGHGRCLVVDGLPTCACDPGWAAVGLACLPCATPACEGGPCPAEMVLASLGGEVVCIDRYEAVLFDSPTCVGTRFGARHDDLPAGFPDLVESVACEGECRGETTVAETTPVYACSLAGYLPSAFFTWFQAKRACENGGKRLCSQAEWQAACAGPEQRSQPYGEFEPGRCNDSVPTTGAVAATGSHVGCEGAVAGLFDMVGNLSEWTMEGTAGGSFVNHGTTYSCLTSRGEAATLASYEWGVRCCRTP